VGYGILVVRGFVRLLAELIGTSLFLLQANPIALDVDATGSPETVNQRTRCLVASSLSCDPILVEVKCVYGRRNTTVVLRRPYTHLISTRKHGVLTQNIALNYHHCSGLKSRPLKF
jgi:hypothetical protein